MVSFFYTDYFILWIKFANIFLYGFCIWRQACKALFHPKIIKIFCDYSMQRNWKEFLPIKEFRIEESRNIETYMNVMRMAVQVTTISVVPMTVLWSLPTMSWTEVTRLFSVAPSCPQWGVNMIRLGGSQPVWLSKGFLSGLRREKLLSSGSKATRIWTWSWQQPCSKPRKEAGVRDLSWQAKRREMMRERKARWCPSSQLQLPLSSALPLLFQSPGSSVKKGPLSVYADLS